MDPNVNHEVTLIIMYQYSSAVLSVSYQCKMLIIGEVGEVRRYMETVLSIKFFVNPNPLI